METTATNLAAFADIKKQSIQTAIKTGKLVQSKNKKFDMDHPVNRAWCFKRGIDLNQFSKSEPKQKKKTGRRENPVKVGNETDKERESATPGGDDESFSTPTEILDGRVRDLLYLNRGWEGAKAAADVLDKLLSAEKKSVDVRTRRLELIDKSIVTMTLFQYLEVFQQQIFDGLESQIDQEVSVVLSHSVSPKTKIIPKGRERAKNIVIESRKDFTAKATRAAKKGIADSLKRLKHKYEKDAEK